MNLIKETWNQLSVPLPPVSLLAMLALSLSIILLLGSGCLTRDQVQAEVWLQTGLSPTECASNPSLDTFGIYRKLNDGTYEFISYCSVNPETGKPYVQDYIDFNAQKFQDILDKLLPTKKVNDVSVQHLQR